MEMNPVDLYYEEHGSGTPLIFLHGFPFDHAIWKPLVPFLECEARLILPDLRGFGKSPVTEDVYSMRLLAEDIYQLLNRLEIDKAILVGHSMGGYVSLAFAHAYPQYLAGMALVSTQAAADTPERRQSRYKLAEAVSRKGAKVVAGGMVDSLTPKKELLPTIRKLILQAQPQGIIGALKGMAERNDLTEQLAQIQVPTVVLAGTNDQILPFEKMETLAQMLPKGWLVEVAGSGHMLMMEEPQLVASTICQIIQKVSEG